MTQTRTSTISNIKPILPRQSSCRHHSSIGGECEAYREKREGTSPGFSLNPSLVHDVPFIVHEVLNSPGQPLDAQTRAFMEPRFGHDFSGVRVHTDGKAAESARAVNALAYTVGSEVVFAEGQYMPASRAGQQLIAHELTHVRQQSSTTMPTLLTLYVGASEDHLEHEAQTMAEGVSAEVSPQTQRLSHTTLRLSRQLKTKHQPKSPPAGNTHTQELIIVLEDLSNVRPSGIVIDTIREAIEPLANQAGRTLKFVRSGTGDLTLSFAAGGHASQPCGLMILGEEGSGLIFVGAHKDLRVCGIPRLDHQTGQVNYEDQMERVFDEEEDVFGRFVGNTAVHELAHMMAQLGHTSGMSNFMRSVGKLGDNLPKEYRTRQTMRAHWSGRKTFTDAQAKILIQAIRSRKFTGGMKIQKRP